MSKCIVINRIPLDEEGKLRRKHKEQVEAFTNMGFDTYSVGFRNGKCYIIHGTEEEYVCDSAIHGYSSYLALFKASKQICRNYGPFDIAYMRMIPATPSLIGFLKEIRQNCKKIVYEFPTFPYDKENNQNKKFNIAGEIGRFSDKIYRYKLRKYVDLAVVFTDQVENVFGIPAIVIRNGINVDAYPQKKICEKKPIDILCMGKLQRWHGYDRIIDGVAKYVSTHNDIPFCVHILGNGDARNALMEQAKTLNLTEDIVDFPGVLVGDDLDQYFDHCSFAVESLGLHRLNLKYSSTLKSREYLARGVPFIYSLPIPGIDSSCEYCYQIPIDESPVNIEAVLEWYESIDKECGKAMRRYARENFSWESQFRIVLSSLS